MQGRSVGTIKNTKDQKNRETNANAAQEGEVMGRIPITEHWGREGGAHSKVISLEVFNAKLELNTLGHYGGKSAVRDKSIGGFKLHTDRCMGRKKVSGG